MIGAGGGMTERPGDTSKHARLRSGTVLNTQFTQRWQFVDGSARRRAAALLDRLAQWSVALTLLWCMGSSRHLAPARMFLGRKAVSLLTKQV